MRSSPEAILQQYWKHNRFRPLQREIIGAVMDGKDTLALLPTGGGKSLCYQIPAMLLDGCVIVVSPLIALMVDQVNQLEAMGIAATAIYAGMRYNEVTQRLKEVQHGSYKILYVSPERLRSRQFQEYFAELPLALLAIDEAHCISQWGYDFRPDYLRIGELRKIHPKVPMLALTASATVDVQADIVQQLNMRNPILHRGSFFRDNLSYQVCYSENKLGAVASHLQKITKSTITYCRSRRNTELLSKQLSYKLGNVAHYHAGMSRDERDAVQQSWMEDAVKHICATTAFGMGIDKPDVALVTHYDAPEYLESWYQEVGRAGRDGTASTAVTLYNSTDITRLRESTDIQFPQESYLRKVYQAVCDYLQVPISARPDRYFSFDIADFCSKFSLDALPASYALRLLDREGLWTISDTVFAPSTVQFTADRETLDDLYRHHPDIEFFCTRLLRMYGSIFHAHVSVREGVLARQLRASKDQVVTMLRQLHKMGVLQYNPAMDGPQLFFHHYRVASSHLQIDLKRIATLRRKHKERIEAMIDFLENTRYCRNRLLLSYFGEKVKKDCGICDVCMAKQAAAAPQHAIEIQVLQLIAGAEANKIDSLAQLLPGVHRETIINCVRKLADEGQITISQEGTLHKK